MRILVDANFGCGATAGLSLAVGALVGMYVGGDIAFLVFMGGVLMLIAFCFLALFACWSDQKQFEKSLVQRQFEDELHAAIYERAREPIVLEPVDTALSTLRRRN